MHDKRLRNFQLERMAACLHKRDHEPQPHSLCAYLTNTFGKACFAVTQYYQIIVPYEFKHMIYPGTLL